MRIFQPQAARSRALAFILMLDAFGLLAAVAASARADPKVLAKIDGARITEDDVNDALVDIGPGVPKNLEGPEHQKSVLDYLFVLLLASKQALVDNVDGRADFARRLAYYHDKLAMEALLTYVAKTATTEEAERKAYDDASKAHTPEPEVHVRHILLSAEEEAKSALARIKAGEDFAKVEAELSKDQPARRRGGELGWLTKDRMIPKFAFADAAFELEPGQVSEPVKSRFGWHIVKVEGKRMRTFPPFEQVKDQVACRVAQQPKAALISSLRDKAKIEVRRRGQAGLSRQTGRYCASERPSQAQHPLMLCQPTAGAAKRASHFENMLRPTLSRAVDAAHVEFPRRTTAGRA